MHHPPGAHAGLISDYLAGKKSLLRTRILTTTIPKLTIATMEMFSSLKNYQMLCWPKSGGAS